jgi:hypothetical protein
MPQSVTPEDGGEPKKGKEKEEGKRGKKISLRLQALHDRFPAFPLFPFLPPFLTPTSFRSQGFHPTSPWVGTARSPAAVGGWSLSLY